MRLSPDFVLFRLPAAPLYSAAMRAEAMQASPSRRRFPFFLALRNIILSSLRERFTLALQKVRAKQEE